MNGSSVGRVVLSFGQSGSQSVAETCPFGGETIFFYCKNPWKWEFIRFYLQFGRNFREALIISGSGPRQQRGRGLLMIIEIGFAPSHSGCLVELFRPLLAASFMSIDGRSRGLENILQFKSSSSVLKGISCSRCVVAVFFTFASASSSSSSNAYLCTGITWIGWVI